MRSGALRHKIAIQEETETSDGMGGFTLSWGTVAGMGKVRAAIWPVRGDERLDALKLEYKEPRKIRIRYRPGITTKNRIYWSARSKTFNIVSINNVEEKNIILDMIATEET